MSGPTCSTCPFWKCEHNRGHGVATGHCRFESPKLGAWPAVNANDWCGDHPDRAPTLIALDTDAPYTPGPRCIVINCDNRSSDYCPRCAPPDPHLEVVLDRAMALESALRALLVSHGGCVLLDPCGDCVACNAEAALDAAPAPPPPVCAGCQSIDRRWVRTLGGGYYLKCRGCGRHGPRGDSIERAEVLWAESNPPKPEGVPK